MPRADLLALTPGDLTAITNRGTVKRAERELAAGTPEFEIEEADGGELVVRWTDGNTCRFPLGKTVHDAICSSGSVGISRYVVRSVLAYQKRWAERNADVGAAAEASSAGLPDARAAAAPSVSGAWDPGRFTDDDLVACFRAAAVAKARQRFQQGILVEVARGAKPLARFLDEPCTLRFMVPGDLRYVTADCAETLLATYVPLAVWAFRALPPDRAAGLVAIQQVELPVPAELLAALESLVLELATHGLANCAASWPQRLTRVETQLREAGLVWPADLAADILHQQAMYAEHDARFDPLELVHLVGELLARVRAIANCTTAVPQLLIRGSRSDRVMEIAGGRMIGLGLGVQTGRRATTLSVYLQDANSGSVAAVERTFANPANDSREQPKDFAALASTVLTRGISLESLACSQLLLKSGKRMPSGRLALPRTAAAMTANPQGFAWEQIKPPVAVESFAQLAALMEALPPSYLRPRRLTDGLHVCAISAVESVAFNSARQCLSALVRDGQGGEALLAHPYHARGRQGFEALAAALANRPGNVRFVCGHVSNAAGGLTIRPIAIVLEEAGRRIAVQPWIAAAPSEGTSLRPHGDDGAEDHPPLESFLLDLRFALSELLLSGLLRWGVRTTDVWSGLMDRGHRAGFVKLIGPLEHFFGLCEEKANDLRWDAAPAAKLVLELTVCSRVLAEMRPTS